MLPYNCSGHCKVGAQIELQLTQGIFVRWMWTSRFIDIGFNTVPLLLLLLNLKPLSTRQEVSPERRQANSDTVKVAPSGSGSSSGGSWCFVASIRFVFDSPESALVQMNE